MEDTIRSWRNIFHPESLSAGVQPQPAAADAATADGDEATGDSALEAHLNIVDGLRADGSVAARSFVFRPIYQVANNARNDAPILGWTSSAGRRLAALRHQQQDASPRRLKV